MLVESHACSGNFHDVAETVVLCLTHLRLQNYRKFIICTTFGQNPDLGLIPAIKNFFSDSVGAKITLDIFGEVVINAQRMVR